MIILYSIIFLFALLLRSRDFFHITIPLGYDPGLYKEMFIRYYELGNNRNFSVLPKWIQSMYEPGLGMIGAVYQHLVLPFSDIRLSRGWLAVSLLLPLATYMLAKKITKETGILAALLVGLSFIQYSVFRWAYRKQTLGVSLILIILSLRSHRKIWYSLPLLIFIATINRASLVRIVLIALSWCIRIVCIQKYENKKRVITSIGLVGIISGIIVLPIVRNFIGSQFLSLIKPFIASIDLPNYHEVYQAGGTFLTSTEYIKTSWYTIIGGIIGMSLLLWRHYKSGSIATFLISLASIIMAIRVFGQFFFFQRMIGYLDVMMCICSAYALLQLKGVWKGWIIGLFLIINSITTFYRRRVIHPPLISSEEFASIRTFGKHTTKDDIIICPGFRYSPWIQGWTSGEVLAPGLFDLGTWGDATQGWSDKRYNQTPEIKCKNLQSSYRETSGKNIYLWIGSKQGQEHFSGACFSLLTGDDSLNYHRYKLQFD